MFTKSKEMKNNFFAKQIFWQVIFIVSIMFQLLEDFIDEFFYENPISQIGIIITKNKRAEKISELSGNSKKHIKVSIFNPQVRSWNITCWQTLT